MQALGNFATAVDQSIIARLGIPGSEQHHEIISSIAALQPKFGPALGLADSRADNNSGLPNLAHNTAAGHGIS